MRLGILELLLAVGGFLLFRAGYSRLAIFAPIFMVLAALMPPILDALLGDADGAVPELPENRAKSSAKPVKAAGLVQIEDQLELIKMAICSTPAPQLCVVRVLALRDFPETAESFLADYEKVLERPSAFDWGFLADRAQGILADQLQGLAAEAAADWRAAGGHYQRVATSESAWMEPWHGRMFAAHHHGDREAVIALYPPTRGVSPDFFAPVKTEDFVSWSEEEQEAHKAQFQRVLKSQMHLYALGQLQEARAQYGPS